MKKVIYKVKIQGKRTGTKGEIIVNSLKEIDKRKYKILSIIEIDV